MNMTSRSRRIVIIALLLAIAVAGLLALDLRFKGLAWRWLWSMTGEDSPLAQIRGAVELGGNLLRQPLRTDAMTPIDHKTAVPYGVNVFLQEEVEGPKIDAMLGMIREAGFRWLRQEFPWEDLEADRRGSFDDLREDTDGDGIIDRVAGWAKYDRIVALSEKHGLRLLVRLSNPPRWSRADPDAGDFGPPDDLGDYVNYATAVAERYRGRIQHYQIWNEPNIYPEWGNDFVDPGRYAELLCRTHDALKTVDPDIVVHSAAIAPTVSLDGFFGFSDLLFLQELYDLGAGACFDVLSAQGYGLFSGPTDRRLRATSVNIARHTFYRDIMVRNGDGHKPIWLSEAAWNATLDAELPRDEIDAFSRYGSTTQEQAARYMPQLYDRAQREWHWIGNIFYWFFTRKDPYEANQSWYYFRMAEPDYQPEKPTFTPLPVYDSVKAHITGEQPTLYRGAHQAETWQVDGAGNLLPDGTARFSQAKAFDEDVTFRAHGTSVEIRWREPESSQWRVSRIELSSGAAVTRSIHLPAAIVDEITVLDLSRNRLFPLVALGLALALSLLATVGVGLRDRFQ